MNSKQEIKNLLSRRLQRNNHLVGVAAGSGMTAKYAEQGGADLILALSSGRFRMMGVSSLAGYLPFSNSNELVMDFATKEVIPIVKHTPVCFGLCATDPTINLPSYIENIKNNGFVGINNYPSVGLIDGFFREMLEQHGITYDLEVEAIRIANEQGLFTVAFVFNEEQALKMIDAGADIICVHLGLTEGGSLGSKKILSLHSAKKLVTQILEKCDRKNRDVIKMIYGGPINKPIDLQYMYDDTNIMGYIGGSVFERIPTEKAIFEVTKSFKETNDFQYDELIQKIINGIGDKGDYIDFVKEYIALHYMEDISLNEVADILKLSRTYLSTLFKKEVGISFSQYLIDFRLNRAVEILQKKHLPLNSVAEMVGYPNYAQFSKIFKKHKGISPSIFLKTHKSTKK